MRTLFSLIVVSLALLGGCANHNQMRFKAGKGDAGQFILLEAVARGGQVLTTNGLPKIRTAWRYAKNQYGVNIRISRDDYEPVRKLLRQAFGDPRFGPDESTNVGKLGIYRLTPNGGTIQFGYDSKGTWVIILRQLTEQEVMDGVMRAMKELDKRDAQ